jgi:hypothetical protein
MLLEEYENVFIQIIQKNINETNNQNNTVKIFSTKFGNYISNTLKYLLVKNSIPSEIIYNVDHNDPSLHIILFSQKVIVFPKYYIIYQLEQKDISKWIDKKYELSILHSLLTFDYSQSNIDKFHPFLQKKIIFYPIPLIKLDILYPNISIHDKPTNNILFFGSMNDIRKQKLNFLQNKLNKLNKSHAKYQIKIINGLYGEKLYQEIINSKIVLNIHFYKGAILETCRINEILSCGRIVISELPNKIDINNYNLYKDIENVIFVKDMFEMYKKIIERL